MPALLFRMTGLGYYEKYYAPWSFIQKPAVFAVHRTLRKIFLNKEFLSTQKMRLPQKRVHQDDSNDTPQPMLVEPCQNLYCGLGLFRLILIHSKGFGRAQPT